MFLILLSRIRLFPAARAALSKTMWTTSSPSESVKSPSSVKGTVEAPSGPRYGRPSDRFGPPTALFSPELALLKYNLEHLDAFMPDSAAADLAFDLIENATNFFHGEDEREAILWPILARLIGRSLWPTRDESWLEDRFAYPIVRIKDEQGLGGGSVSTGFGCIQQNHLTRAGTVSLMSITPHSSTSDSAVHSSTGRTYQLSYSP